MNPATRSFLKIFLVAAGCIAVLSCTPIAGGPENGTADGTDTDSVDLPAFSYESGIYSEEIAIELSTAVPDAAILYTTDGSDPYTGSERYSTPIPIPADEWEVVIKAAVLKKNGRMSGTAERHYTVKPKDKVATPKLSPSKGTYDEPIEVTITCATAGAVIHYTTDGTKPGPDTAIYSDPIPVPAGTSLIIKAVAYKEGLKGSSYAIGRYTVTGEQVTYRNILFKTNRDSMEYEDSTIDPENPETKTKRVYELYIMAPNGSSPTRLTTATSGNWWDLGDGSSYYEIFDFTSGEADWSPDGTKIAYSYHTPDSLESASLYTMDSDGSNPSELLRIGVEGIIWTVRWSPAGDRIGFTAGGFGMVDFNMLGFMTIRPDGSGFAYVPYDNPDEPLWCGQKASWGPYGQRYVTSDSDNVYIVKLDTGETTAVPTAPAHVSDPDWHPFQSKIAYADRVDGQYDIFVMNTDGSGVVNLTDSPGDDTQPDWSVDGMKIAFSTNRDGNWEIYTMNADGSDQVNLTNYPDADETEPAW